eukprot:PITA_04759
MSNYEREASIRLPVFDGTNFVYWKVRVTAYLQSLGTEVWDIIDTGYAFLASTPIDPAEKNKYETNAKAVNTLLGCLSQSEFVKVIQYKSSKEIWDKIVLSYEGDDQVKRAKLQTLRIQYENIRMYNDESVANYFLRVDEIVNYMKNLGEEVKEAVVVEKVLRSLSPRFESKVSAIEEKENPQNLKMSQLHGILTAYEMREGGPSYRREVAFKASGKGDNYEFGHISEEEKESNFVKNLQRGTGRFRGKLPFKCFACGRVGHYAAKCPHKDKLDKGKEPVRWNKKQNVNKKAITLMKTVMDFQITMKMNEKHLKLPPPKVILMQQEGVSKGLIEIIRSRFWKTTQKEQTSSAKTWRMKEPQPERCGIDLYAEGQENQWYIDSGCSKHMTAIKGKGIGQLKEDVKAGNVLYVDGLKHNLLSVSQMCDNGTEVTFRSDGCSVRDLDTGRTVLKGKRTPNNLYIFEEGEQQCYVSKNDEHWLWHRRLGHLSFSQIRKACKYQAVRGLPDIKIPDNTICKACQFGKQT